jgi:hypothetical protein
MVSRDPFLLRLFPFGVISLSDSYVQHHIVLVGLVWGVVSTLEPGPFVGVEAVPC